MHTWLLIKERIARKPSTNGIMADPDVERNNAYQAVVARSFTQICRRPIWEQKESFLREARDTSMLFDQDFYN